MTEQIEQADLEPDQEQADDQEPHGGNAEAKKYRLQRNEARAELTQLREQLDAMRNAEIQRHCDNSGVKVAALWASGAQLEQLLDEAGTLDADKITQAIDRAREELGIGTIPSKGAQAPEAGKQPATPPRNAFADAFRPQR